MLHSRVWIGHLPGAPTAKIRRHPERHSITDKKKSKNVYLGIGKRGTQQDKEVNDRVRAVYSNIKHTIFSQCKVVYTFNLEYNMYY